MNRIAYLEQEIQRVEATYSGMQDDLLYYEDMVENYPDDDYWMCQFQDYQTETGNVREQIDLLYKDLDGLRVFSGGVSKFR